MADAAEPVGPDRSPDRSTSGTGTRRLDVALVERGLATSRNRASTAIRAGRVRVDGRLARRPSEPVGDAQAVVVAEAPDWASRAGGKLDAALDAFDGPAITGRRCLDAGASTGGFTDVLLRRGARRVVAVDVGHDQLIPALRDDPRVDVREGLTVRGLTPADLGGAADLVVADLSFISLTLVLPDLLACAREDGDVVPMVKPQFEVGRDRLGSGGVVREEADRLGAAQRVALLAADHGWGLRDAVDSAVTGPAGNRELFLWLRRDAPPPGSGRLTALLAAHPSATDGGDAGPHDVPAHEGVR